MIFINVSAKIFYWKSQNIVDTINSRLHDWNGFTFNIQRNGSNWIGTYTGLHTMNAFFRLTYLNIERYL